MPVLYPQSMGSTYRHQPWPLRRLVYRARAVMLGLCVAVFPAAADPLIGLTNPPSAGWIVTPGDSGTSIPIVSDPEFPSVTAREISLASGRSRFQVDGPDASESWTFITRVRVVDPDSEYASASQYVEIANQVNRFLVTLGSDDGNTELNVVLQSEVDDAVTDPPDIVVAKTDPGQAHTDYINLAIAYNAAEGAADIFVNDVERYSGFTGIADPSNLDRALFGDGVSGDASNIRFALVDFQRGDQACRDGIDNDGDGLVDFAGGDPDCTAPNDPTESTYCALGEDIDIDGFCENVVGRHYGDRRPETVGWAAQGFINGVTGTPGIDQGADNCDAPCGFWQVRDPSTAGSTTGTYAFPIAAAQYQHPLGWVYRGRLRIVPFTIGVAESVDLASTLFLRIDEGIGRQYFMRFGLTAQNQLLVRDVSTGQPVDVGPGTDYHEFEMVYDPDRDAVDVLVDGGLLYAGDAGSAWAGATGVSWGSGASADRKQTLFHEVSFETAPDTDDDGIPDMVERRAANPTDPYSADSDEDGASDWTELDVGTDPNNLDTDGDGLGDGFEILFDFDPLLANPDMDFDNDGLTNLEEQFAGTDPTDADSDGDSLTDGDEVNTFGTDPTSTDSDKDGLADNEEVFIYLTAPDLFDTDGDGLGDGAEVGSFNTDPFVRDSDGDGAIDGLEVATLQTDPLDPDTDGDGLLDGYEYLYPGLDPLVADFTGDDSDGDGLDHLAEQAAGSSPNAADTDGDGLDDSAEVALGSDPASEDTDDDGLLDGFENQFGLQIDTAGDERLDPDADGLGNLEEQEEGTDPTNPDTDGDGVVDGQEVYVNNTDPLIPDQGKVAQTAASALDFESSDQPLFTLPPPQTRIDMLPQEIKDRVETGGTFGEVHEVNGALPLSTWQEAWDRGLAQCTATRRIENVLPNYCKTAGFADSTGGDFFVTPSTNECLSGVANIASRTLTCCREDLVNAPDTNDSILNGCDGNVFNDDYGNFTIADANGYGAGIPTTYDTGLSFPPRPTVAPPAGNYLAGLEVTVGADIDADLVFTAESSDPGDLDLTYATTAILKADSSSVAVGDTFRVSLRHAPRAGDSSMASTWAPIGLSVFYEVNVTPEASGTFYGLNPYKAASYYDSSSGGGSGFPDFQDQQDFDLFGAADAFSQTGEFFGLTAAASDAVEIRILDNVQGAPEIFRDTVLRIDSDIINFNNPDVIQNIGIDLSPDDVLPPGTALPISVPNFLVGKLDQCPLKFLKPAAAEFCLGLTGPGGIKNFVKNLFKTQVTQELLNLRLQLPEVNTPVSSGFNGGRKFNVFDAARAADLLERARPLREQVVLRQDLLDEGLALGALVNTVPNGNRPLENWSGNSGSVGDILDTLVTDETNLGSDTVRFQLDIDGALSPPGQLGIFDKTIGNPFVGATFGLIDFDAVVWAGIDQKLEFEPNLKAEVGFSRAVMVRLVYADTDDPNHEDVPTLLPAGSTKTLPAGVRSSLAGDGPWLEVTQPAGGVDISATYSFDDNVFTNTTRRKVTIAPQINLVKFGITGLAGAGLSGIGVPNEVVFGRVVPFSPPQIEVDLSDNRPVADGGNPDLVRHLAGSIVVNTGSAALSIVERGLDADADSLPDALELAGCTSELDADSDDDGLGDGIEDSNRNGVVDAGETDPCDADSDDDGLSDGYERGVVNAVGDPDAGGPASGTELALFTASPTPTVRTDPLNPDTDGDGDSDGVEISNGTDPLVPNNFPSLGDDDGGGGSGGSSFGWTLLPAMLFLLAIRAAPRRRARERYSAGGRLV